MWSDERRLDIPWNCQTTSLSRFEEDESQKEFFRQPALSLLLCVEGKKR